jgi:hypothetical protein
MLRLVQLPPKLLLEILLLPLGAIGNIVTLLPNWKSKLIAIDAFETKVLRQLRNGNAEFVIHAPSMNDISRGNRYSILVIYTLELPGK